MANKKKKVEAISQTKVAYEGNVELKIVKGKKVLKNIKINNSGTKELFRGIAYALRGDSSANIRDFIPNFIGAGLKSDSQPINKYTLAAEIGARGLLTNKTVDDTELGWKASYTGLLTNLGGETIYELGLFGTQINNSLLARVVINDGVVIPDKTNLIVTWTISIQNEVK